MRRLLPFLAMPLLLVGCSGAEGAPQTAGERAGAPAERGADTLRLGYFANVTHASAVYGIESGAFAEAVGDTRLEASVFNAGPAAIEGLAGGSIDAAFIGPNPVINGFARTGGELLRIVAGTTSGGATLVVRADITSPDELDGRTVATPQLGNTQDVAAKTYFAQRGVDVDVVNQENATTLDLFARGRIDGAWVPEPWASRMVLEGGARALVDEADLWPDGQFVTTHLVVRKEFLDEHPDSVADLLNALVDVTDTVSDKGDEVKRTVNAGIRRATGRALSAEVMDSAFAQLTPTVDPIASSLQTCARNAQATGLLEAVDLAGIYDVRLLNEVLAAQGRPPVDDAGLGA